MGSEAEPLLDKKTEETADYAAEDYAPVRSVGELKTMLRSESVKLWKLVTTLFVGHLGDAELSAVTISLTVVSTLCYGFLGCDASILVYPSEDNVSSEMESTRNFAIRNRESIGVLKSIVEVVCPQKVSCAQKNQYMIC
ncbi:Peroxidase 29 [Morus notabilis]|uniref:Peroxidase 29 n=1 Tax=Morus notabilis TaxID=981085 RepID=W9RB37_9ROSA|nr:Peroxidase 29 [Morus notabilis]